MGGGGGGGGLALEGEWDAMVLLPMEKILSDVLGVGQQPIGCGCGRGTPGKPTRRLVRSRSRLDARDDVKVQSATGTNSLSNWPP